MNYSLTDSEQKIMDILWKYAQWMTIAELGAELEKDGILWKRQTINTFLSRLIKKGLAVQNGRKYIYTCTKEEFQTGKAREFLKEEFGDSFKKFVVALSGHKGLNQNDMEGLMNELEKYR